MPLWFWLALLSALALPMARAGDWGGMLGLANDDRFRGLSYSPDQISLQAELHYTGDRDWFAGTWLATVEGSPDPQADLELNAFVGHHFRLSENWQSRVELVHYAYLGNDASGRYDFDELRASFSWAETLTLALTASPNTAFYATGYGVVSDAAWSGSVVLTAPLTDSLWLSGGGGYYELSSILGDGYWFGSLGLTAVIDTTRADLAYIATDAEGLFPYDMAADGWLLSLSWLF